MSFLVFSLVIHGEMRVFFSFDEWCQLLGPGVCIMREGTRVLYVGCKGVRRMVRTPGVGEAMKMCTSVEVRPCSSSDVATEMAGRLIREMKPEFNKRVPGLPTSRRRMASMTPQEFVEAGVSDPEYVSRKPKQLLKSSKEKNGR